WFVQAGGGVRDRTVTGVQTCALPISRAFPEGGGDAGAVKPGCAPNRLRPIHRLGRDGGEGRAGAVVHDATGADFGARLHEIDPRSEEASCRERVKNSGGGGCVKKQEQ